MAPRAVVLAAVLLGLVGSGGSALRTTDAASADAARSPQADPARLPVSSMATSPEQGLRILTIGDSTTQGFTGDYTWRYRLAESLAAGGVAVDFVGERSAPRDTITDGDGVYADPDFDSDHAAVVGMQATALRYDVVRVAGEAEPDVVVINLGVNDILQGVDAETTAAAVGTIIDDIRSVAPRARFVVAHQTQSWIDGITALNSALTVAAMRADEQASPVVVAPVITAYELGVDTWDRYHPNGVGEVKIAQQIQHGLRLLGLAADPVIDGDYPAAGPALELQKVTTTVGRGSVGAYWAYPSGLTSVQVAYRDLTASGSWQTLPDMVSEPNVVLRGLTSGHRYELALRPGREEALSDEVHTTHVVLTPR